MKWAYGVTTVPTRMDNLLPRTLASLAAAGFDKPRLFVDGARYMPGRFTQYETTFRYPVIRTAGNWVLSLYELYIREPAADRYAVFQDDFVTYRNLRQYLEKCEYPARGYWNLYTFPRNQVLCPAGYTGWYLSDQMGKGAVALVLSREAVVTLLSSRHLAERPMDAMRGHRVIDGGIVESFKEAALRGEIWKEYVHNPSLVQHTGLVSSMGSKQHLLAQSFRGEDYDAVDLLQCSLATG